MSEQTTTITADGEAVEYRDIQEWPGYRVGSDGSVWTCLRVVGLGDGGGAVPVLTTKWRRKSARPRRGYPAVTLFYWGKARTLNCHQLVMQEFVGPCPEGMEIAHANGIRADSRLSNLSYKTKAGNEEDKIAHGTKVMGERHGNAKLTAEVVRAIRADKEAGMTYTEIGRRYGVDRKHARDIVTRKAWSHV